jgi:RNA polymerase sigma factor (sigma-70 family)
MSDDLEMLWVQYKFEIASYIGKNVRGHDGQELIDDMVSSVFLRALVATHNGNGCNGNARGWLYQIARSVMWDTWRAKQHTTLVDWDSLAEYASEWSIEEEADRNLRKEQLWRAVDRLGDKQQDAVCGRLLGYNNGEIAEMFGSTESGIKALNTRAYVRLRELLQDAA